MHELHSAAHLEENEENADRVLDIQQYVNRQNKKCSKKKFMKVLETLVPMLAI